MLRILSTVLLLALLQVATAFSLDSFLLRDQLAKAKPGDYFVTCQNKTYTVFHINQKNGQTLTFEEIAIPAQSIPSLPFDWKRWVQAGANGQTSWVLYQLDADTGSILRYLTLQDACYRPVPQTQNFISTLIHLRLDRVPDQVRKRVGPAPQYGAESWRQFWQPRLTFEGVVVDNQPFGVYRTTWPGDGSNLSGKTVEVYLPEEGAYPSYFPYWLEVNSAAYKFKLRVIDSGTGMISPAHL